MQEAVFKLVIPLLCLVFLSSCSEHKHRTKRRVVFSKSSKFFFRLNGKDNVLNHTEIFAHGWTIRVNYDLPESIPKRHQFFKRDVHAELDRITDESTLGIYSCALKFVCENVVAVKSNKNCGIFCGIGNIISNSHAVEADFFKKVIAKCDYYSQKCLYLFKDPTAEYMAS